MMMTGKYIGKQPLTVKEKRALVIHEQRHAYWGRKSRVELLKKRRELEALWNEAADYTINPIKL